MVRSASMLSREAVRSGGARAEMAVAQGRLVFRVGVLRPGPDLPELGVELCECESVVTWRRESIVQVFGMGEE